VKNSQESASAHCAWHAEAFCAEAEEDQEAPGALAEAETSYLVPRRKHCLEGATDTSIARLLWMG